MYIAGISILRLYMCLTLYRYGSVIDWLTDYIILYIRVCIISDNIRVVQLITTYGNQYCRLRVAKHADYSDGRRWMRICEGPGIL